MARGRPIESPERKARRQAERERWAVRIRAGRTALGDITQAEFGALVGVTSQAVSEWEGGRSAPTKARRLALEKILPTGRQQD